jgi:C-terminal peptidase prc
MTRAMFTRLLGAVFVAGLLASPLRAEEAKHPQPYVVLVGISKYADQQIKPRLHAEDDAAALYKVLADKKYLGVDAQHGKLLLGDSAKVSGSEPATRENILKALHWIADNAKSNDPVVFGFFGEGGPLGESGSHRCYFASDSTFQGRNKDAVAAAEIGEILKKLKSQRVCVLLDVNFKGFTTTDKKVAEATLGSPPYKEFLGDDGSEDHIAKPGRALFLATNGLQTSLDLKDHGVFAEALLKGIEGAADKDGYEPDGVVTVDELTEYVSKEMGELTRTHGKTREQKEQFFWALGGQDSHFVLTHNPAVAAKMKERLDKFEQLVKDGKASQKYAEEGKTFLARMPRLEAQRNLRKQYQALVDGKIDLDKFVSARDSILAGMKLNRDDAMDFAQKVMEAVGIITEGYVKKINQNDLVAWAIKGLYRQVDEKVPAKIEERLKNIGDLRESDLTVLLADARQALGKREDLDKHKDIDFTLQRMLLHHVDPYTTYIDPDQKKKLDQEIIGRFPGVGIQIRKDAATDQLLVVTPIKGSPAYKAGIQAGDLITTVTRPVDSEGKPLDPPEVIPTKGMPLNKAVTKIIGQPGTPVKLTIKREGEDKPLDFDLTRGYVEVESVLGYKRTAKDDWDYMIDPENKIGYIRLTSFARNSYRDIQRVMDDLTKRGIKGFILDLRFNPGGLLDSAVKISDLYIDDGVIVSVRPRRGREQSIGGVSRGSLLDFPMVCLVNGYSASGSEIVSAALQDHKRAYVVGERSYGKGSVQNIQPFEGGELKLTTATFWRPSKKNLNKSSTTGKEEDEWGVLPDKIIKLTAKERGDLDEHLNDSAVIRPKGKPAPAKPEFKDKQLDSALDYLRGQIKMAGGVTIKKAG